MDPDEGLLEQLTPTRRAHSRAVAEAATSRARYVPAADRQELVTAALLHDVGYAVPEFDFHPIDGARHLQALGYSPLICHLVATHTAAHLEAAERGLPIDVFEPFRLNRDTRAHREVLMWADLTTSPTGNPCTVSDRLDEITHRYQTPHPVFHYVTRWRSTLAAAVAHPERNHPHVLDHPLFERTLDVMLNADARKVLLLWDVDHTLIDNGGVSKQNYALAFTLLTGKEPHHSAHTGGRTDSVIMPQLLADNGVPADAYSLSEQLAALREAGQRNRQLLAQRGRALPGALATLKRCQADTTVIQTVLTGNIEGNAFEKLHAFGLAGLVDFELGAFGHESTVRSDLVAVAQHKAARSGFDTVTDITVLVGDTPRDIEAGRDAGVPVIGVATGGVPVDDLLSAGATCALNDLSDAQAFDQALSHVRRRTAEV